MEASDAEIARRKNSALDAIKRAIGAEDEDVRLFVSHHLSEIEEAYWLEQLGTSNPESARVLDLLVLRSYWGEGGISTFDFTLPGGVTDYVIAVRFSDSGEVREISMES